MLDHMLFNKLKWWSVPDKAKTVKLNNMNYVALPKVKIKKGSNLSCDANFEVMPVGESQSEQWGSVNAGNDFVVQVAGVLISDNVYLINNDALKSYVFYDKKQFNWCRPQGIVRVSISDCEIISGG